MVKSNLETMNSKDESSIKLVDINGIFSENGQTEGVQTQWFTTTTLLDFGPTITDTTSKWQLLFSTNHSIRSRLSFFYRDSVDPAKLDKLVKVDDEVGQQVIEVHAPQLAFTNLLDVIYESFWKFLDP